MRIFSRESKKSRWPIIVCLCFVSRHPSPWIEYLGSYAGIWHVRFRISAGGSPLYPHPCRTLSSPHPHPFVVSSPSASPASITCPLHQSPACLKTSSIQSSLRDGAVGSALAAHLRPDVQIQGGLASPRSARPFSLPFAVIRCATATV